MPRGQAARPIPDRPTQQDTRPANPVSVLSGRINPSVEAQGRLQSLAAQCAGRLAARYESEAGARAIRELGPSLILAFLAGYEASVRNQLGQVRDELAVQEVMLRKVGL